MTQNRIYAPLPINPRDNCTVSLIRQMAALFGGGLRCSSASSYVIYNLLFMLSLSFIIQLSVYINTGMYVYRWHDRSCHCFQGHCDHHCHRCCGCCYSVYKRSQLGCCVLCMINGLFFSSCERLAINIARYLLAYRFDFRCRL